MRLATRLAVVTTAIAVTAGLLAPTSGASVEVQKARPVKQWVDGVCGELAVWKVAAVKLTATSAPKDPGQGKAQVTKLVKGLVKATDVLAKQLKRLGVPRVDGGEEVAAAIADAVDALRAAYTDAKSEAAALPTGDRAAFSAAVEPLPRRPRGGSGAAARRPRGGNSDCFARSRRSVLVRARVCGAAF